MDFLCALVAVPAEARAMLADPVLALSPEESFPGGEGALGTYLSGRYPLRLVVTGVGKANAAWALARVPAAARYLSLGASGALDGRETLGIWISGEFVEHDMDASGFGVPRGVTPLDGRKEPLIRCAGEEYLGFLGRALAAAGIEAGRARSASGDKFVSDIAEADYLRDYFGAELVDMECAALAKLCLRSGAEYAAIRAVSDNADHGAKESFAETLAKIAESLRAALRAVAGAAWGEES